MFRAYKRLQEAPKVLRIKAFWAVVYGFWAIILSTLGVQVGWDSFLLG